jgi:hypothetical protein
MKSRIIFGNLYKAEEFAELSEKGKLLAIYLMTNESIGLVPAYKLNKREVCFWLGLDQTELESLIGSLTDMGIFLVDGYVILCNMYSNYIYHKGENNKNKDAMFKEFLLLPPKVQERLGELGFDLKGVFITPYGYLNGTSKVFINNKQEIRNKKQEILNKKSEEGVAKDIDMPEWLKEEK